MDLTTYEKNSWNVIALHGAFIIREQHKVRTLIEEVIKNDAPKLAFDLTKTTYLDSSALGMLVKTGKDIQAKNGDFMIFGANKNLMEVFSMVHLGELIKIRENLEE